MKKRILCYGDSNTWGYTAGTKQRRDEDHRWTGICQKELGEDYIIIEDGLNGRTTVYDDPVDPYKNGLKSLGYSLTAQKPLNLVVLMLGTNDFKFTDVIGAAAGVDELVRTLLNADYIYRQSTPIYRESPKVLVVAPIKLETSALPKDDSIARYSATSGRLSELCEQVAKTRGTYFLDAAKYGKPSMVDGIHMDEDSHRTLGIAIAEKIKEILQ